ncbi:MAG: DNA polymerase III subunit delta [Rhodospirillales bacterium]|nr:MAG: DNA polymerase III subunit delta [Rhodospirillales bacterium]
MKLKAPQIESFVRKPDPAVRAILVFGPDSGLVRERAERLVAQAVSDPTDPFLVAELTGGDIAGDPARLFDEAAAIPLTGGRRVVRLRDAAPSTPPGAADAVARAAERYLEDPPGDSLVILQAGDLAPRSALRRLFEKAPTGVALPCYHDDSHQLDRLVDDILGQHGVTMSPDARAYLAANLGSDRGVSRAELEKMALYAGDGGRIELADAEACIGDTGQRGLDRVAFAAGGGDRRRLDRELAACLEMGESPVGILRAAARHLMRIHLAMGERAAGATAPQAVRKLQPPVFWKQAGEMARQVETWSPRAIIRAQELLLEAERDCKRTNMPDAAICGRALLQVATLARRQR